MSIRLPLLLSLLPEQLSALRPRRQQGPFMRPRSQAKRRKAWRNAPWTRPR